MRDAGMSYGSIATWLNAEEIPAKRGGWWNAPKVRSVVTTTLSRRDEAGA